MSKNMRVLAIMKYEQYAANLLRWRRGRVNYNKRGNWRGWDIMNSYREFYIFVHICVYINNN